MVTFPLQAEQVSLARLVSECCDLGCYQGAGEFPLSTPSCTFDVMVHHPQLTYSLITRSISTIHVSIWSPTQISLVFGFRLHAHAVAKDISFQLCRYFFNFFGFGSTTGNRVLTKGAYDELSFHIQLDHVVVMRVRTSYLRIRKILSHPTKRVSLERECHSPRSRTEPWSK